MRKSTKYLLASLILIFCLLASLVVSSMMNPALREYSVIEGEKESIIQYSVYTAVNGEFGDDYTFHITADDPQLYIYWGESEVQSVAVTLMNPIPAGTPSQLFFITEFGISQEDSEWATPIRDTDELIFSLPASVYCVGLRLDIDGQYQLKDIEISPHGVETREKGLIPYIWEDIILSNWILSLAVLLLAVCIPQMIRFRKEIGTAVGKLNHQKKYTTVRGILYCVYLAHMLLFCVILTGHTHLTDSMFSTLVPIGQTIASYEPWIVLPLLAMELLLDWKRAILCGVIIYFRYFGQGFYGNTMVLVEFALLASLSNLGSRKQVSTTWLITALCYTALLIYLNVTGGVTSMLTSGKKHFFFLPSIDRGSSWGMIHPNSPGILLMAILLMIWWKWKPKSRWITLIVFWLGAAVIWGFSMNRTVTALMILFPAFDWLIEAIGKTKRWKILYVTMLAPLVAIFATWFFWQMSGSWSSKFGDGAFWIRFTEMDLIVQYGAHPFGLIPDVTLYLDNFYTWLIMSCGTVPTALLLIAYTGMMIWLVRNRDFALLTIALLYIPYSITEHALVYPIFFFAPLLAFCTEQKEKPGLQQPQLAA